MAILSGYLPVEQGVACYAALRQHADTAKACGDGRTRDQIMADTLVERLTGQPSAGDVNVELQIMMPLEALLDPHSVKPATIPGYGPLPADLARDIMITSQGRKWWRRLFTAPSASKGHSGPVVGGDSSRRCFEGWLARLIRFRDQETCRNPFCAAPIRHIDHISRHSDGGATSYDNGRGTCERCNYVREMPGWQISVIDAERLDKPHTMIITTPTGHHYLSRPPDPP
jgi:HNH endonuclease